MKLPKLSISLGLVLLACTVVANTINTTHDGDGNLIETGQSETTASQITIDQIGNHNTALATQSTSHEANVQVNQVDGHSATIAQVSAVVSSATISGSGAGASATVLQSGEGSSVFISQQGNVAVSTANIDQQANNAFTMLYQTGAEFSLQKIAEIVQRGDASTITAHQYDGGDHTLLIEQNLATGGERDYIDVYTHSGDSNIAVYQDGFDNRAHVHTGGGSIDAQLRQSGNDNDAYTRVHSESDGAVFTVNVTQEQGVAFSSILLTGETDSQGAFTAVQTAGSRESHIYAESYGLENSITAQQSGLNNLIDIYQSVVVGTIRAIQTGNNNTATLNQQDD